MRRVTYAIFRGIGRLLFKKPRIYVPECFDPHVPSIFMCNHAQNYGPIITVTRFPVAFRPWCHTGVVYLDESFDYIRDGFFMTRLRLNKRIAGFLAKLIARPLVALVNMNHPIPTHHNISKCFRTIHMGTRSLLNGENQLIFANVPLIVDGALNPDFDFMRGYLLVVRGAMKNGVIPRIYPVSINKDKAAISIGEPISPDPRAEWDMEKKRIHDYLVAAVKAGYEDPQRKCQKIHRRTYDPGTSIQNIL